MTRIALIQDGTEVARQRFADVARSFERCCASMSEEGIDEFSLQAFTDEDVGYLLEGIERDEWQCLVFASNALLSGQVENAVTRNVDDLRRYMGSGGGVVVLHQQRDSLSPLLEDKLLPRMWERRSPRGLATARAADAADVLLHYPFPVDWSVLRDLREDEVRGEGRPDRGSELPSLFFKALDPVALPASLKPVLEAPTGEVVVARTDGYVPERVVIATAPLDWQSERPRQAAAVAALLANAVHYASLGAPRRLVWRREQDESNPLLVRWLALDGATALRTAPSTERQLDETETWLLSAVDVFILPADRLPWLEERDVVQRFLAQGGTIVAAAEEPSGLSRVTAVVGRHEERALATRLYAELRAVDGWRTADYAFELRNIARALTFLWSDDLGSGDSAAVAPQELLPLVDEIRRRLADPTHREDLGSSVALAETLALLQPGGETVHEVDWLADGVDRRPFEVALQIRSVLALASGESAQQFLHRAADALIAAREQLGSLAPLVRVLDAAAGLDQRQLLDEEGDHVARLAEVACDLLDSSPANADRGWMSVEATAQVTRGLVALYERLPKHQPGLGARVAGHVATGATVLRSARRRYERNAKGVAWLSCVVHAIVAADRIFPIGLQRLASLEWPDRGGDVSSAVERALLQQLASANEKLRTSERDLQERLADQLQQRLAATIGRAAATIVPAAALVAAAVFVLYKVGWSSLGSLLLNIAALSTLVLAALGIVFAALGRWHLLAAPAPRIRQWLEENAVSAVKSAGGIKRG